MAETIKVLKQQIKGLIQLINQIVEDKYSENMVQKKMIENKVQQIVLINKEQQQVENQEKGNTSPQK